MTGSPNELASANPFFTVGHSTRSICDLAALLREAGADFVVDVRTVPRSGTNPQFNRDTLSDSLAEYQIGYAHLAELGGLRGKQHVADRRRIPFGKMPAFAITRTTP